MSWTLLFALVLALGFALLVALARRAELARMRRRVHDRERAVRHGSAKAQLQHPVIDLSRCLGCGTCVAVCPEEGVLELVHGQAMVVNGARCAGVSACERECPVGAITVRLTDLEERTDIPVVTSELEAVGSPGLFLAGEVTAHALIKTAVEHGTAVAAEVARRVAADPRRSGARRERAAELFVQPAALIGSDRRGGGRLPHAAHGALHSASTPTAVQELAPEAHVAQTSFAWLFDAAERDPRNDGELLDLCIVGAGPAGLACSLEAKRLGLAFVTIDQESGPGGTVAKYPRRKLVMTQPVDLPLHGRMTRTSYTKEELMELWQRIVVEEELPLRGGETFQALERDAQDGYVVRTDVATYRARNVCLAIGRRGTPRKLGVPGEELSKVAYSLLDAHSYQGRRILVVGGGDSAVEAALGLAEQPGNSVTLSYRQDAFFRIRARNEERLSEAVSRNQLAVVLQSSVLAIHHDAVDLEVQNGAGSQRYRLPNDDVFVMAGGLLPVDLLTSAGVSFDPKLREASAPITEQGTGIVRALASGFALALAALGFALWHADYYALPLEARPVSEKHMFLRPGLGLGLWLGIASTLLIVANLMYLVRRSARFRFQLGSLRAWMTSHVATGILALLCATLHGGMSPRDTVGGHALWALAALLVTGAIGRYFYAYVPRAANGRELEVAEVKLRLERLAEEWDASQKSFVERVRQEVAALIEARQWQSSFVGRVRALLGGQRELKHLLVRLADEGADEGVPEARIEETLHIARTAHDTALMAAHYEDLRAVLNTWRYLHRWVAALMVLLLVMHVVYALTYGAHFFDGGSS